MTFKFYFIFVIFMEKALLGKISLKEIILIFHCKENIILPLKGTKEKKPLNVKVRYSLSCQVEYGGAEIPLLADLGLQCM